MTHYWLISYEDEIFEPTEAFAESYDVGGASEVVWQTHDHVVKIFQKVDYISSNHQATSLG